MRSLFAVALAAVTASCAQTPAEPDGAAGSRTAGGCFFTNSLHSFTEGGRGVVHVHAAGAAVFELRALGYCRDIDWAHSIGLRSDAGRSSLCVGDMATLHVGAAGGPMEQCRVQVVRRLGDEEREALRQR